MLLYDSLTAAATSEALLHAIAPSAEPWFSNALNSYMAIFLAYDEVRRWFY